MNTRYVSLEAAATYFGVTARTLLNWSRAAKFPRYEMPGGRTVRVRIDEIEAAIREIPGGRR